MPDHVLRPFYPWGVIFQYIEGHIISPLEKLCNNGLIKTICMWISACVLKENETKLVGISKPGGGCHPTRFIIQLLKDKLAHGTSWAIRLAPLLKFDIRHVLWWFWNLKAGLACHEKLRNGPSILVHASAATESRRNYNASRRKQTLAVKHQWYVEWIW